MGGHGGRKVENEIPNIRRFAAVNNRRLPSSALSILLAAAGLLLSPAADVPAALLPEPLAAIGPAVAAAIAAGETPGAVVLIGHEGRVVLREAFGHRSFGPPRPMTPDAVFDLASLTKVVATATAVLQLAEQGRLDLDAPVARYWPEFKGRGKGGITLRQLLTHYSGLRPGFLSKPAWSGHAAALQKILADTPAYPPGSRFVYSDLNFTILGELVRRVSWCMTRIPGAWAESLERPGFSQPRMTWPVLPRRSWTRGALPAGRFSARHGSGTWPLPSHRPANCRFEVWDGPSHLLPATGAKSCRPDLSATRGIQARCSGSTRKPGPISSF
ncbi:MAG: class A beta-lactamase-related serine hydrolase [Desulfobacteraceae bacterium]|nr:MAG: class A beta-lactamase-related serine hydrolase [Desulfobacteraceae bacterium]